MKKHLASIESTKPEENTSNHASISCLSTLNNGPKRSTTFSFKKDIVHIFQVLKHVLSFRVYLLPRDVEKLYKGHQEFFRILFRTENFEEVKKLVTSKEKWMEKEQIGFLVKIVLELDRLRKQMARQGHMKDFEELKHLIEYLEEQTVVYEKMLRARKYELKCYQNFKEKQSKDRSFSNLEQFTNRQLQQKKGTFEETISKKHLFQTLKLQKETQSKIYSNSYRIKPSKLMSEAKNLSLRTKLAPYAVQLKRSYDYNKLKGQLLRTIDQDMERRLSMISHMKNIEKSRLNNSQRRRYSVLEDRLEEERRQVQRQLKQRREQMQKGEKIKSQRLKAKEAKIERSRIYSLQKSFNAYNMYSDRDEIKLIIKKHKEGAQFMNNIEEAVSLDHTSLDNLNAQTARYNTMQNRMLQQIFNESVKKKQLLHEAKILRNFKSGESDQEAEENYAGEATLNRFKREHSLVALYDNELEEIK